MYEHQNFTLSQMAILGSEESSEESSKQSDSSEESQFTIRSSFVRERCGYSPPNPMLGVKKAVEEAQRYVKRARELKGATAVKSFENAIAMYYLADFVRHDEINDKPEYKSTTTRYLVCLRVYSKFMVIDSVHIHRHVQIFTRSQQAVFSETEKRHQSKTSCESKWRKGALIHTHMQQHDKTVQEIWHGRWGEASQMASQATE